MKGQHSIFYYVFIRVASILILAKILHLSLMIPYISEQLKLTVVRQADIFAKNLLATYTEILDQQNYSSIAYYGMQMIKENPDIIFIEFKHHTGSNIVITADNWGPYEAQEQHMAHMLRYDKLGHDKQKQRDYYLSYGYHALAKDDIFNYSRQFALSDQKPVNITLGIKNTNYQQSINGLLKKILGMNSIVILATLLILFITLRYLCKQINKAQQAVATLAAGNLSARMSIGNIIETNSLACSFNKIADDINSKINKIDLLTSIIEQGQDAIVVFDKKKSIKFANLTFKKIVTIKKENQHDLVGKNFVELMQGVGFADSDIHEITANISARNLSWYKELHIKSHYLEGRYFNIRIGYLHKPIDYDYVVIRDITQRKIFEQELNQLAFYDKLTKLPNRRLFLDRLEHTINTSKRRACRFALMFMDLDNFKRINDTLGHDYGDELLQAIAMRLTELLRQEDTVCRLGGDEFTIILNNISNREKARKIAEKIIKNIKKPYYIKGKQLFIGISIGIVNYPSDAKEYVDLMKKADLAMYQAKRAGKNRFFFHQKKIQKNK